MRIARFCFIFLIAAALLLLSGCDFISNLKARDQLNKGVKAFKNKDYETATDHFKRSIELDGNLDIAYEYLATSYRAQYIPNVNSESNIKVAHMAIDTFTKVFEKNSRNSNAIQNIATLYNQLGEYDKSKAWYKKWIEIDPKNKFPFYGIGVIDWTIVHQEIFNEERAKTLKPEEKDKLNASIDEGIAYLKQALEIDKEYSDAMSYLNLCYRKKAMLTDDETTKNEYIRQADRLAQQSLILKNKQKEEEEKKKDQL